jgi:putative lipoprotein
MRGLWLVFALHGPPSTDRWLGADKVQHFLTSAFVQSMSYGALRSVGMSHGAAIAGASTTTAAVGVGKEWRDRAVKGEFSSRDLVWDAAGGVAATALLLRTNP